MTDDTDIPEGLRIARAVAAQARADMNNGNAVAVVGEAPEPEPPDDELPPEPPRPDPGSEPSDKVPPDAPQQSSRRKPLRDQLLSVFDLAQLPAVEPLVDGLLYCDTLAQLSGGPGSFKSFISVGVACALASGQTNWEGHRIPRREHVVYVVAEGTSGLYARILAWCERNRVEPELLDGWLHILPVPIQLGVIADVGEVAAIVQDLDAGLVVIDTRARCTVGLDENSATEQGRAIQAADTIRSSAKRCTVWVIHHSGRNGSNPRGSNAWDGAVWTDLRLVREDFGATITVEKHKDAPDSRIYDYRMVPHTVSDLLMPDQPDQARNTLVAFSSDGGNRTRILTANENRAREIAENSCGLEGLTRTKLVELVVEDGMSQSSAYRAINALIDRGVLVNVGTAKRARFVRSGLQLPIDDDQ